MIRKIRRITENLSAPLLFALFSIVVLTANNIYEIDLRESARSFIVAVLTVVLLFFVIWLFIRDGYRAALIAFMAIILFFSYGHVREIMKSIPFMALILGRHRYLSVLFVIIFIVSSWFVMKRINSASYWTRRISLIGALALIFPVLTISSALLPGKWEALQANLQDQGKIVNEQDELPDIYYIILDGYGREDVLDELYGFDNSEFLISLQDRGFYIADESLSNYNTTRLSLASSLNLNYLQTIVKSEGFDLDLRTAEAMIRDNRLTRYLNRYEYETVSFETSRQWSSINDADHYFKVSDYQSMVALLPRKSIFNQFETMLIKTTFLSILVDGTKLFREFERSESATVNEEQRVRIILSLQKIQEIPHWQGNYFTFLHVLSPHPPFIFGASGEPIDPDRPFSLADGNHFMERGGTKEEYIEGYIDQLQYINMLVLETVVNIIAESSNPPIIVIQGDHGPGAYLDWQSINDSNLVERHGILNAYYLPYEHKIDLYPSISPVNSFRVILDAVFDVDYELLEDLVFFTEKNGGYHFVDISERVD